MATHLDFFPKGTQTFTQSIVLIGFAGRNVGWLLVNNARMGFLEATA